MQEHKINHQIIPGTLDHFRCTEYWSFMHLTQKLHTRHTTWKNWFFKKCVLLENNYTSMSCGSCLTCNFTRFLFKRIKWFEKSWYLKEIINELNKPAARKNDISFSLRITFVVVYITFVAVHDFLSRYVCFIVK